MISRGKHDSDPSPQRYGFALTGPRSVSVILIHDLGATPVELAEIASRINQEGFAVTAPILPGHEDLTHPEHLSDIKPAELVAVVDRTVRACTSEFEVALLVGFGLGGSLSLAAAAGPARVAGVAGVAGVGISYATFEHRLAWDGLLASVFGSAPGPAPDIKKADVDEMRLTRWPRGSHNLRAQVEHLGAISAANVTVPTLLFHSRNDHVVPRRDAALLAATLRSGARAGTGARAGAGARPGAGAPSVELVWLERSFHQAWIDHDAELIGNRIAQFAQALDPTGRH